MSREVQERFDRFWSVYPKKRSKAVAAKSFERIDPDDELLEVMVEKINHERRSYEWAKDGGQYIPLPATWLNQRRWEDEETEVLTVENPKAETYYDPHEGMEQW